MKISFITFAAICSVFFISCKKETADPGRQQILEVEGKFLYLEDIQDIIPPNVDAKDSSEIADSYIRKWVTDVLLYENAKRNLGNQTEIDKLLEEYKKSLIIHQYQQKLIKERLPKQPSEDEIKAFYEQYKEQLTLKENVIQGILLITPETAPQMANVRSWVKSGNEKALENIEKYSMQHAISYDYFADRWLPFSEVLKRLPLQLENQSDYLSGRKFVELSDSTKHYFLSIKGARTIGQTEPYEMAKPKIINLIMNKLKSDFITNFEAEIYNDAIKSESVTFFNKQ